MRKYLNISKEKQFSKGCCRLSFFSNMISAWDVAQLPAADVEPVRHGRWIPVDEKEDAFDCSECDAMAQKRHDFCPKCGAKMNMEGRFDMENKKKSDAPDYERIAGKIVRTLFESSVTYRESEVVLEYVRCKLQEQLVQDSD